MGGPWRRAGCCAVLLALALPLTGCAAGRQEPEALRRAAAPTGTPVAEQPATVQSSSSDGPASSASPAASYAVADPGRLTGKLLTPDLLITSTRTIPASVVRAVTGTRGVASVLPLSLASLSVNGRTLTVVGADPAGFRRFTPLPTAQSDAVWSRVAGGEIAVDPSLPRKLEEKKGYLRLGSAQDAPEVHIGAYAPLVKEKISAVMNLERAAQLGLPAGNALLVSTGELTPSAVTGRLRGVLGPDTTMATLALEFDVDALATAVLSGTSVSQAVGTFSYTPHPNGTVTPEARWVREYIRRANMPIIGEVTGNKGMLPQLRAALDEVVARGLADKIHPGEYGGCYVPRFIANDPAKGLSLHSWGIAVDLNVPGNQRGTVGQMDRQVVAIFKKWGFAWGGDWNYTDPMHFELAKVVQVG
jgi:hypothetical protein